jgi:putative endonuclease
MRSGFAVYILQSQKDGRYYIGHTRDLPTRLDQHNRGASKSTRSHRPWKLVYCEEFTTKEEAIKRESQIKKKKSRLYIDRLRMSPAKGGGRLRVCLPVPGIPSAPFGFWLLVVGF